MKKILSLILAGLMTLSCAAFVAADDAAVDAAVEQSNTAEDYAIEFLANYGIFKGTSPAELVADADASIQRYQMALFVSRISTGWVDDAQWEDGPANNSTFEDIGEEPANKYLGALSYANQNGIIEGYSATKFAPYDGITYRDALTMVVRTLGYKGLAYPWGYIEKAVELGLTEDVNVAYTDNLTRGQVAVIIYNAMFAATKSGETLAKKIFNCDFGWQEIVIVASNEASFAANGLRAKDGYVAFKLLGDDGKLGKDTYYVKKAELGLDGDHDDELEVGAAYLALFTIKDDIVSMVDADSLNYKTVYNMGITDNAGEAVATMPIKAALSELKIVKEYQKSNIISDAGSEIIIYSMGTTTIYDEVGSRVAIDWNTQNILVWKDASKDEKGNVIPEHWDIAWYYNETLDRYYELVYDKANHTVGINWMSDEEFVKFYKEAVKQFKAELQEYKNIGADGVDADAAYAELRLFDTTGAMGLFKKYAIGQIYVDAKECKLNKNNVNHADGKKYPTYKITNLDGEPVYEQFIEKDHTAHEYLSSLEGTADKDGKYDCGYAWLNVADFVTTFYKEDGSFENGSIVLYNVNKTTGEIEIIKHITTKGSASDDADSYIATGVLKAYNTNTPNVNIDGEKLPLGYKTLNGAIYGDVAGSRANKLVAADTLDKFQMQYVTYIVVDGRVVDIDLRGETSDVIIVLGYAGVTSDGYIAVYGYGSKDTSAKIYRIASYNAWKKGDYRYYPANAWTDEAFKAGTIYNVTSHDDETDTYNVYTENTDMSATAGLPVVEFTFDSGYRIENTGDKTEIKKMSKDDKYVIVYDNGTIFVKTGIISNVYGNWGVKGNYVKTNSGAHVFYVHNNDRDQYVSGFNNTANEIGYVLYDKDSKVSGNLSAGYDDAIDGEWYLLGSSQSSIIVRDLLTGNKETVIVANNVDLVRGRVYVTYNFGDRRVILNQFDDETHNPNPNPNPFLYHVATIYNEWNVADARFMVDFGRWVNDNTDWQYLTFTKADAIKTDKQIISMLKRTIGTDLGLVPVSQNQDIIDRYIGEMIGDINFFYYKEAAGKVEVAEVAAKDLAANATYTAAAIYDVATKKVVVYIYSDATTSTETVKENGKGLEIDHWIYDADEADSTEIESTLKFDFNYTYTATKDSEGKVEEKSNFKLGTAKLYFDTIGEKHGDKAIGGYIFGIEDEHERSFFSFNDTIVRVSEDGNKVDKYPYAPNDKDNIITLNTIKCGDCSLVDSVSVDLSKVNVVADQTTYVRFIIAGDNYIMVNGEKAWTGNSVEVSVRFNIVDGKVVATLEGYKMNGNKVAKGATGSLNHIDLTKLG